MWEVFPENIFLRGRDLLLFCCRDLFPRRIGDQVDKYELSQKEPKVDPSADAEIIFWDVRIEDRVQGGDLIARAEPLYTDQDLYRARKRRILNGRNPALRQAIPSPKWPVGPSSRTHRT